MTITSYFIYHKVTGFILNWKGWAGEVVAELSKNLELLVFIYPLAD